MKIGTITFWYSKENYGAMLQCWALLRFLNKQGHDAKLLKVQERHWSDINNKWFYKITNVLTQLSHPSKYREIICKSTKTPPRKSTVDRHFTSFLEKHIPSYPNIYTYEELNNSVIDADAIIVGSDQVWSGFSQTYFLNFNGGFKRISYAPSFGGAKFENPFIRWKITSWLKKFDLITVREKEGVALCQMMGLDAKIVPDPTLLLGKEDYLEIMSHSVFPNRPPYLFLYLLGNTIEIEVSEIMEFAKKNNLEVVYVASQGREDEFIKSYPTIENWLGLVYDAKYVVTNSFHGTVFSLVYEKPFLTIPLVGTFSRMNGRIEDLLAKYDLKERIYHGSLCSMLEPIDFTTYKEINEQEKTSVIDLLNKTLI